MVGLRKSWSLTQRSKYMTCSWRSLPSGVSRIRPPSGRSASHELLEVVPGREVLALGRQHHHPHVVVGVGRSKAASSSSMSCVFWALAASGRFERDRAHGPVDLVADGLEVELIGVIVSRRSARPSARGGGPRTRSPMMVRWISLVPAKIDAAW